MANNDPEHREEETNVPAAEDEETAAQIAPIIKLEEVAVSTGEEDEDVLLDLKSKLYRFDKEGNQWKERGHGNVKLLKHKETGKVRLVMRQSKTLKICANHYVFAEIKLQEHAGNEKSCVWHAPDCSEGEIKDEMFAIRFGSIGTCKLFMETVEKIAESLRKNEKDSKEGDYAADLLEKLSVIESKSERRLLLKTDHQRPKQKMRNHLLATVNEATIVPSVSGQLNNLELAVNLAKRGNLPEEENLVVQRFQELFSQAKYKEAAELAADSPQGILRTPETVANFQSVTVQAGQTSPLLRHPDVTSTGGSSDGLSPRTRFCDVFIGVSGRKPLHMFRFIRWLRAELEAQGIWCYVANRGRYKSTEAHEVARVAMDVATFGVVVISGRSFSNPYCIEEIKMFLKRRRLVPIFFELPKEECSTRDIVERRGVVWERYGGDVWEKYGGSKSEWKEAVDGLLRLDLKLEAHGGNFRDCILDAVVLLASGLGRGASVMKNVKSWKEMSKEEFPFPQNTNFVGRNKELIELENLLFGYVEGESDISRENRKSVEKQSKEGSKKGKQPMTCNESTEEIEMQSNVGKKVKTTKKLRRTNSSKDLKYMKGLACVSGDSGIGKTELLLEFAHRFYQRYKMVLWVGGESRFFRQNYMKLLHILETDLGSNNMFFSERNGPWTFEQIENISILTVKRELMKDVPYLLVIDNLERENDWWDGRNVMDLLPRFIGATHVLISTRLPHVASIRPMRLLYLSGVATMTLMKGSTSEVSTEDINALSLIEEKLGKLPLGLALVGTILSEVPMNATKLLETINAMPYIEVSSGEGEDVALRQNPFLVQLLDFCFSICERKLGKLALRMVQASDLFAPLSVPISMLVLAAKKDFREHHDSQFLGKCTSVFMTTLRNQSLDSEALAFLVKFQIGRTSTNSLCISFHDVVKFYARKRGNADVADSVVRAVSIEGSIPQQLEHIWAACFLLFKFGSDPVAVNLPINDLLSFIEQLVLPLGSYCVKALFRCNVILELLRCATETLETLEESFLADVNYGENKSSCFYGSCSKSTIFFEPLIYKKFAHLRATLLETRANLMVSGSIYDIAEKLCRTAVNIKEVIYGWEHPETVATRETLERILRQDGNMYKSLKKKIERGVAFPTCVSVNNTMYHYSPLGSDETILEEKDIVKINMGRHIDGFIAVVAHTHVIQIVVTGSAADVIVAANTAAEVALRLVRTGKQVCTWKVYDCCCQYCSSDWECS